MKKQDIIAAAQNHIKGAEASLAKFAAELVQDPERTVHWSSSMFGYTANIYAWKMVLNMAENDCSLDVIVESLTEQMAGSAVRPANSSNFAANHLEQEKLRAVAEIYRDFERRRRILRAMADKQSTPAPNAT